MGTLLLFIIVLSLLVFVHELGHFLVAKKTGMKVEEFGFGFPPRLFGVKRGDTIYSINWIPLGGFVRIKGESGDHKGDPDSFASKKVWQRFSVLIAGVAMNFVLAAMLFSIGFMMGLPQVIDERLPASARVSDSELTIMTVVEGSPAAKVGIQQGDVIATIDGQVFTSADDARVYIAKESSDGIILQVKGQNGQEKTYKLASELLKEVNVTGVGIGFIQTGLVSYPFFQAIVQGVGATAAFTAEVFKAFAGMIASLATGHGIGVDLSGPVGIAVITGQVAALGLVYLLQFTALLSINLAVINALPFPALDGGRILFLLIEKLRGKAVNEKMEITAHNLGFMLLMVLVVLVTYKDFVNFGDEILSALKSLI
jgi:regulator of sigma E protease